MTASDQEDQAERRRVLLQDAYVRANANRNGDTGTYLSHTHSEVGGRFAVTEHQTITGVVSPAPPPLPANSPWHGSDPVPDEPPLGYRIDAMPEFESPTGVSPVSTPTPVATDDPAHAPSGGSGPAPSGGLVSERAGSSLSSETMAAQGISQMSAPSGEDDAVRLARPPTPTDAGNG
jgi:hypothetical protein